jgi:glycosyltransferase involved in cell wall biosynthesis
MIPPALDPALSIVIPIYNEEPILHAAVVDLRERMASFEHPYEVLLAENGSRDRTRIIAADLADRYPEVRVLSIEVPNYGRALKKGILAARGRFVVCDEIDLCDTQFYRAAFEILTRDGADFVVGSKLLGESQDERPWIRHAASIGYTTILRMLLGFRGTDTHGAKAFARLPLEPVVQACQVDKDVFASELVIRADRCGLRVTEIPVRVIEKRPPSINLFKRVPNVLVNLARLTWAIRGRWGPNS